MNKQAVFESELPHLECVYRGKVRDIYALDSQHFLIVASDRLSAFDVIMDQAIPGKGEVLTRVANFWFARTKGFIANHLSDIPVEQAIPDQQNRERLGDRITVVKRLKPLPIEAVVRGYIVGSGWKEYQAHGSICDIPLPQNLALAEKLAEPIFTPATKAALGDHDENINFDQVVALIGGELAEQVKDISLRLYGDALQYAAQRGIIIADTKFEFGLDQNNTLHLIDEVLTPDSSRFWPVDSYQTGLSPPSFDKQFLRDYLETLEWNKTPPPPKLPEKIIQLTAEKYAEAEFRLLRK